jgi:phosphorylase/glycogen(starch) synthase
MSKEMVSPDYLFETSWEVCNKVGGIYTVISTKVITLTRKFEDRYILIGPDIWRDEKENPEFTEDPELFSSWRFQANQEGLRVKTGRWNISGNPIVILVDFTPFISLKDEIFRKFWETFKLDSISGQWDYIEPALFGYAAAKTIESFRNFYLEYDDKIIAQFHEWMTGLGILYLDENVPRVATIFTTHATVLGRALAGNNRPLYGNLNKFNAVQVAREFSIIAKQSLEKTSAIAADAFTTVSEITSQECIQFFEKEVDVVTPNGFEDSFIPSGDAFDQKRRAARKKFLDVASALSGAKVSENALLVATSGRYEFRNKGIPWERNCCIHPHSSSPLWTQK